MPPKKPKPLPPRPDGLMAAGSSPGGGGAMKLSRERSESEDRILCSLNQTLQRLADNMGDLIAVGGASAITGVGDAPGPGPLQDGEGGGGDAEPMRDGAYDCEAELLAVVDAFKAARTAWRQATSALAPYRPKKRGRSYVRGRGFWYNLPYAWFTHALAPLALSLSSLSDPHPPPAGEPGEPEPEPGRLVGRLQLVVVQRADIASTHASVHPPAAAAGAGEGSFIYRTQVLTRYLALTSRGSATPDETRQWRAENGWQGWPLWIQTAIA